MFTQKIKLANDFAVTVKKQNHNTLLQTLLLYVILTIVDVA